VAPRFLRSPPQGLPSSEGWLWRGGKKVVGRVVLSLLALWEHRFFPKKKDQQQLPQPVKATHKRGGKVNKTNAETAANRQWQQQLTNRQKSTPLRSGKGYFHMGITAPLQVRKNDKGQKHAARLRLRDLSSKKDVRAFRPFRESAASVKKVEKGRNRAQSSRVSQS